MAAPTQTPPEPSAPVESIRPWYENPTLRIVLRWVFIGSVTLMAFWESFESLVQTTRQGGFNGYLWTLPVAAVLAAQGVARRPRTELPIHDRQTDIIVGTMGLVLALMLHGVLMHRYEQYFYVLRLDFFAMYVFILSSAIALFGLRPVSRFVFVWLLLSMMFTLPYHLAVIVLGGSRVSAGGAALIIAGSATGIAVGRTYKRGWFGGLAAWAVGLAVLAAMAIWFPYAPVFAYQAIPALTATALVGVVMFFYARRGAPKRALDRKVEPLAARQVVQALPLVLVAGVLLSLVDLPRPDYPSAARFDGLQISGPLNPPAGWRVTDTEDYTWVKRLHGRMAHLTRQRMVAEVGNPDWDKFSRPRTVVVDNVVTDRPFSFEVYPARVLYDVSVRLSEPRRVDLGYGITGEATSVVDDEQLLTYNMLQWTWRNAERAQRIVVISVDNHEPNAPFPNPSGALVTTLNKLLTVLFRGNSAVTDRNPAFKDIDLLTAFGRGLVAAQIQPLGRLP
ncbi:hypothetical protein [Mycobacterium sp. IDR2000157661]|uniref:hypothetical protein n=1 Tax=Mycobacterium sp. IDR2000157661 TaxID=2867005 RepID=UPI001EEBCBDA|nr:hypothetical protein [Mycobacterium sp. IDR2000157661]ULE33871.1 hypothetical protein K3G64_04035 [Mycobacterium sp. IDR2000157661]